MTPDRIQISRPAGRTRDPHAWVPEAIHGAALVSLAVAVAFFVRVFYGVRAKIGLDGERGLALVIGFLAIELYLLVRSRRLLRRAWGKYQGARSGPARPE